MSRYLVRTKKGTQACCESGALIEVNANGKAFLILDRVPSIRADTLEGLLQQLRLRADDLEPI